MLLAFTRQGSRHWSQPICYSVADSREWGYVPASDRSLKVDRWRRGDLREGIWYEHIDDHLEPAHGAQVMDHSEKDKRVSRKWLEPEMNVEVLSGFVFGMDE